ncbi:MAG: Ig-like domain-containing protein [Candidatus Shapirobacteria bacterium]|nr:Ig-like domain-containing protein [Candidatus Shapirobacteria bacterium]
MRNEKKIPTILGLVLLLGTTFLGVSLSQRTTNTSSRASGTCEPINPQVTNITHNSASISFTTSTDCSVTVNINNQITNDSRDKKTVHYFEINNLENSKVYQFTVISDGNNYTSDEYTFKTAKKPDRDIPNSNLAWGRVFKPDKSPASEAIIYLNISGASPLSALVTSSGNWNIPLSTSFSESLNDWFSPPSNTEENFVVIAPEYNQTEVVGNSSNNNPVPDIILGENVFNPPPVIDNVSDQSRLDGNYDLQSDYQLNITNPQSNEEISAKRPDFFGTGQPKSTLKIKVESPVTINDQAEVAPDGSWNWSPPQDLTPGEHTITVTDEKNNIITRKFTVLAAESNTSFSASSSSKTITPTKKPTLTPTKIISTPTSTPKPTATPIPVTKPSTSSGVPRSGDSLPTVMLLFSAFIALSFALIYYKKS